MFLMQIFVIRVLCINVSDNIVSDNIVRVEVYKLYLKRGKYRVKLGVRIIVKVMSKRNY